MQDRVQGTVMPVLEITLEAGESVVSEVGEFSWMSDAIELSTGTGGGVGGQGVVGALKRMAGGSSFLLNTFTAQGGTGMVAFAAKLPGKIVPVEVTPGAELLAHRHGFMAGTPGVEISVALQQTFRGGIFGGEGFLLQRLAGNGRAWIELSGEVLAYDLAAGQTLRVHPGHVGLFEASVRFEVVRVPGLANRYLGDDGHHFVVLTGPGRVHLQSMPLPILAGALRPYLDLGGTAGPLEAGAAGGAVAGALGSLFKR
jgi:uncharacterized protein (TIGR00266 family)